jgi:hypothetical protein
VEPFARKEDAKKPNVSISLEFHTPKIVSELNIAWDIDLALRGKFK